MKKNYGFSKIGERLLSEKSGNRKDKRISVIAVKNSSHNLCILFILKDQQTRKFLKHI
jgi:hypothetical protein